MQFLVTLHHFLDHFFFYLSDWECFTNYPNTFSNSSWFFRLGRWRWNIHSSPRRIIIHSCCCSSCCCCCSGCSCCCGGGGSRCWCSTALRWRWEGKLFWWSSTSVATLLNKSSVNSILTSIFQNQEKCCFRSEVSWRRWIFLCLEKNIFTWTISWSECSMIDWNVTTWLAFTSLPHSLQLVNVWWWLSSTRITSVFNPERSSLHNHCRLIFILPQASSITS